MTTQPPMPETIENLGAAVFPSFAMLAGMQLELFTLLNNGPMDVVELAQTLYVGSTKLEHLLYSSVDAGLLIVEGQRFSNTVEPNHYLVRGKATYMGERHHQFSDQWNSVLRTSESIRTGAAKAKLNFHEMTPEQEETVYRGLHPTTLPPDEYCLRGMISQPTALCWTLAGVLEGLPSVLPRNVLTSTPLWGGYLKC